MIVHDLKQAFVNDHLFRKVTYVSGALLICKLLALILLPITPHAIEDWYIANNIVDGNGYSLSLGPTALKTPVYPLFLLPFALLKEQGLPLASAVQHLLWFISVPMFMRACALRFNATFALLAGVIFALHPAYGYYPFVLESTALTVPLFIGYWYASELYHSKQEQPFSIMMLGWIVGLCQPILLPAIIMFQLFFSLKFKKSAFISLLMSALIVFTPWTIRNALTFHAFIPMKSPMWMNFYEGMTASLNQSDIVFIESSRKNVNDVNMEPIYKQIVVKRVITHWDEYISQSLHRMKEFWLIPDRYANNMFEPRVLISRVLPQVILLLTTLATCLIIMTKGIHNNQKTIILLMIGTLLYVSLIYAMTQAANIRFKMDIEWLQIVLLYPIFQVFTEHHKAKGTTSGK